MLRLLADEDLQIGLVLAVRRIADIEFVRVQDIGLVATPDPHILEYAAQAGFVVVTHDRSTMRSFAETRVREGRPMPGLIVAPQTRAIGPVAAEVAMIAVSGTKDDMDGRVVFVPL